jgi:sec-independent protein translocase protein TatA
MGLPNIGPLELIIILAIALLIVGPGRLPEMGNAIGRTIKEFRKASSDITDGLDSDKDSTSAKSSAESSDPAPNTLSTESKPNTTTLQPAPATSSKSNADGEDNA